MKLFERLFGGEPEPKIDSAAIEAMRIQLTAVSKPTWIPMVADEDGGLTDSKFQIDSEGNLPYMFGDVGCGHVTQCPEHPHSLGFGWACC